MVIKEGKITMDLGKVKGVQEWPTPTMVKQVWSFLGFGNFYRWFIQHFSKLAKPLNDLLKKDHEFLWTTDCQKAFNTLKRRFTEEPVLKMPDQTKPFQIECDTSKYTSGAVLTQLDFNGDRHPCAFFSKAFLPPRETMKFMTENSWQSFEPWKNGDITYKDRLTPRQIIKTWHIIEKQRNWTEDRPAGCCTYQNSMLN